MACRQPGQVAKMKPAEPGPEAELFAALERAGEAAEPPQLARVLGEIERLKAIIWQRLVNATTVQETAQTTDTFQDLRHLTPEQVAEVLSLKTAYVHELCRAGRIPATKSGKYWMIPVAGLRQWLAYQKRDVDHSVEIRLQSLNPPGDVGPRSRRSSAPRPQRTLTTT